MNANIPIPMAQRQAFAEGSKLASARDSRNNPLLWRKARSMQNFEHGNSQALQKLSRQVSKMQRRIVGGGGSGIAIQDFQVVSDGGDWYNCYPFDGLNVNTTITKVAKHQDLRCILPSASPAGGAWVSRLERGITYTYAYLAVAGSTLDGVNVVEYSRTVTGSDASTETDLVTPCLNCVNSGSSPAGAGDIITAFQTSFAGPATLANVVWQAFANGRAWAGPKAAM